MHIFIITRRKKYLAAAAGLLAILLLGLFSLPLRNPAAETACQKPIYEVDTAEQAVAISFDASWGAEYTPQLLDILDQYGVKTTFFLVNIWLEDYPELAREIVARGHEIGLHSATHPHFSELSVEQMQHELDENAALIEEVTGYQPELFRPPFGDYNDLVVATVNENDYYCVQWSIDSLDWSDNSAEEIYQRVTKDIHAGDIVLFHNNGLHTAEALGPVLDYLASCSLEVIPVGELLLHGDYYVDLNGIQRSSGNTEVLPAPDAEGNPAEETKAGAEAAATGLDQK